MSQESSPQDLLPSLNKLVRLARKQGASGIELLYTATLERRIKAFGTKIQDQTESESRILSGRVFVGNGASASFSINADSLAVTRHRWKKQLSGLGKPGRTPMLAP
jgi:predicted Zn-dependent protease